MNRHLRSALTVAATAAMAAALAAIASGTAYADDITLDTAPFSSSKSRADVRTELMAQAQLVRTRAGEWALQGNGLPRIQSAYSSEQARAEYKVSRDLVRALNGEDSGSAYFMKAPVAGVNPAVLGGPAR